MSPPRVIAIIAAYNEADIIGAIIGDLVSQGVEVYLLDHGSTDDTVEEASRFLGRGLLHIEPFDTGGRFALSRICERKQELASRLDASWFINADADELRESPWADQSLREGIALVDRLGYNAIDFAVFNFRPTHDNYRRGDDLRTSFSHYEPNADFDAVQIRCWKKLDRHVELVRTGGHDAEFEGRRVFPLRFVMLHYPVRTQAQGERKVFRERMPRFAEEERRRDWHIQYDRIAPGHSFVRDPRELIPYDAEIVRAQLAIYHRELREKLMVIDAQRRQLDAGQARLSEANRQLDAARRELMVMEDHLDELFRSRAWRWMAPARLLREWLRLSGTP